MMRWQDDEIIVLMHLLDQEDVFLVSIILRTANKSTLTCYRATARVWSVVSVVPMSASMAV